MREMIPKASRNNYPCSDLLESGRRMEYLDTCVPLYKASVSGDWEAARVILEGREHLVRYSITENKETTLHVAATSRSSEFVRHLVEMMSNDDLQLQNGEGNTAFCLAAIAGNIEMVKTMIEHEKGRGLLTIRGKENMMSLYLAASHGQYDMVTYLYDHSQRMASDCWTDDDRNRIFSKCIEVDLFDVALKILDECKEIQFSQEKHVWDVLDILARKPDAFDDESASTFQRIVNLGHGFWASIPSNESEARHLLRKIWKKVVKKPKDEIDVILRGPVTKINEKDTYPCRILFIAAKMGNAKFLVELIREYPDLMWKRNDDGQSIFHVAVFYRHECIYNLLHEIGSMRDMVTQLIDKDGNNMLHSVAMNPGRNPHEQVLGPASQMQHELLWFEEVKAMVPPRFREIKNADGQTPYQLFTEKHKDLVSEGEEWIKGTINQSMVAAALISTIGFSVAFSIPGGYDQNNGFPIFLRNKAFMLFVTLDALSFILSSTSILMFLSIMISRYAEADFLVSLPKKLILGQATLFLSILTAMVAFSVSFFVLYHNSFPVIISALVMIPVILFFQIQYPLWINAFRSIYTSRHLFKPKTHILYYENPRF